MVELKLGPRTVDLAYTVRLYGVTGEMFDELVDEDTKAELIDGVMIVHSPASPRHDVIGGFLRTLLNGYARRKGLGRVFGPNTLVHLSSCRRFAPDAFFLQQGRIPTPLPRDHFEGAPDLVLGVLSPSNRDEDLEDKRPAYRRARVKEIWLVDPDARQVLVDRRRGRRYTTRTAATGRVTSAILPGFWVDTNWLWNDPPPEEVETLQTILG